MFAQGAPGKDPNEERALLSWNAREGRFDEQVIRRKDCSGCFESKEFPSYFFNNLSSLNRAWVGLCEARARPGARAEVDRVVSVPCQETKVGPVSFVRSERSDAKYVVQRGKSGGGWEIGLRVGLYTQGESRGMARRMFEDTKACFARTERFFARYGLGLRIEARLVEDGLMPRSRSDSRRHGGSDLEHAVALVGEFGTSHTRAFHYFGQRGDVFDLCVDECRREDALKCRRECEEIRQDEYCTMVMHELGHFLGLNDEYADPRCPARPEVQKGWETPVSLMGETRYAEVHQLELYPRHLGAILAPVCRVSGDVRRVGR